MGQARACTTRWRGDPARQRAHIATLGSERPAFSTPTRQYFRLLPTPGGRVGSRVPGLSRSDLQPRCGTLVVSNDRFCVLARTRRPGVPGGASHRLCALRCGARFRFYSVLCQPRGVGSRGSTPEKYALGPAIGVVLRWARGCSIAAPPLLVLAGVWVLWQRYSRFPTWPLRSGEPDASVAPPVGEICSGCGFRCWLSWVACSRSSWPWALGAIRSNHADVQLRSIRLPI